jgi:hypothetical protein
MPHCVVCRLGGVGSFLSGPFPVVVAVGRCYFVVRRCADIISRAARSSLIPVRFLGQTWIFGGIW